MNTSEWDREEVVILVTEYYRTKHMSFIEIKASQQQGGETLRKRMEILNGEPVDEKYRNMASILRQFSRSRAIDPASDYSKIREQKEVMKEYLENPRKINEEAAQVYKKHNWTPTDN